MLTPGEEGMIKAATAVDGCIGWLNVWVVALGRKREQVHVCLVLGGGGSGRCAGG